MASTPMSPWFRPECGSLWEQVDRRTTGTIDEDEDVLWHAHARIEALAWARTLPGPALRTPAKRRERNPHRRRGDLPRRFLAG